MRRKKERSKQGQANKQGKATQHVREDGSYGTQERGGGLGTRPTDMYVKTAVSQTRSVVSEQAQWELVSTVQ